MGGRLTWRGGPGSGARTVSAGELFFEKEGQFDGGILCERLGSAIPSGTTVRGVVVIGESEAAEARLVGWQGEADRQSFRVALGAEEIEVSLAVPGRHMAMNAVAALAAARAAAEAAGVEFVAAAARQVAPGRVELAGSAVECDVAVLAAGGAATRSSRSARPS